MSNKFPERASPDASQETFQPPRRHPIIQASLPFLIGGLSGIAATICIQPVDMVKVRLQILGSGTKSSLKPSPFKVAREIVSQGRFLDLYTGLSAGLLRQVVYGTARLGFFFTFEDMLKIHAARQKREMTLVERSSAALMAGGLGAIIGNPTEVGLVRMQSDGMKLVGQRANYRSVFDALARIMRKEGVLALWNGATPTVIRAMATNFGQLATFSEAKFQLGKVEGMSPQIRTIAASTIAGLFASLFSLPFDFVKTRLQSQSRGKDGTLPYKGMTDCFSKVAKDEGVFRFYRGFNTYFMRMAPHTHVPTFPQHPSERTDPGR